MAATVVVGFALIGNASDVKICMKKFHLVRRLSIGFTTEEHRPTALADDPGAETLLSHRRSPVPMAPIDPGLREDKEFKISLG
jgi:hypothetical protein